jgi:polysulfide reductase chain C
MEHYAWGAPVAIDLFAAGLGAAMLMVAVVANLAGGRKYRRLSTIGALAAPWPVIIGVVLLIIDLGRPLRFWEMILMRGEVLNRLESPFIMFKIKSTMSIGIWLVVALIIVSFIYLIVAILAFPYKWAERLQKIVGVIAAPIALLVTTYTGVLIAASNNVLWNNWMLPVLFVSSAIVTGIAGLTLILAFIQVCRPEKSDIGSEVRKLEKLNSRVIVVQLIMVVLFIIFGISSGPMKAMIGSAFGLLWWIGVIFLGLIVPLIVGFKGGSKRPSVAVLISTLVLLGGFTMRYVILIGGQI